MSRLYLQNLWLKLKHSHPLRLPFDAIARLGLLVQPYYLLQEGLPGGESEGIEKQTEAFETGYLGREDMKAIAAIPGRNVTEAELLRLLEDGKRCLGARRNGELAAFTWFDLNALFGEGINRPLESDEAYLFDAYTLVPFRGTGVAAMVRRLAYRELAKMGRTRLYSISYCLNTPSIRFKKKLGARILELWLQVRLFGARPRHIRLRKVAGGRRRATPAGS